MSVGSSAAEGERTRSKTHVAETIDGFERGAEEDIGVNVG